MRNEVTNTLVIVQKKTKELNAVPICSTAEAWMPPKKDDKVFHLPAHANVDAPQTNSQEGRYHEDNLLPYLPTYLWHIDPSGYW